MVSAITPPEGPLWVFGYGSLMWDPRFPVAETRPAVLYGYHRALCILSIRNRGTPERPGLVVGLDRGGSCVGQALRVEDDHVESTLAYLAQRELSTNSYAARYLSLRCEDDSRVQALTFVARPGHPQYVGDRTPERLAALIHQGVGPYGTSLDYLRNVIAHLEERGIPDGPLHHVLSIAEAMTAPG